MDERLVGHDENAYRPAETAADGLTSVMDTLWSRQDSIRRPTSLTKQLLVNRSRFPTRDVERAIVFTTVETCTRSQVTGELQYVFSSFLSATSRQTLRQASSVAIDPVIELVAEWIFSA